jgi:hypothetical protein
MRLESENWHPNAGPIASFAAKHKDFLWVGGRLALDRRLLFYATLAIVKGHGTW